MAAVIGPIGIEHLDFRDAGVALFLVAEIFLTERHILGGHGEAEIGAEGGRILSDEVGEDGDVGRGRSFAATGDRRYGNLVGIDGVDDKIFNSGDFLGGECAFEDDDLGGKHEGTVFAGEDLDALGGGIRALVELSGEKFDGEGGLIFAESEGGENIIHLRLGEDVSGGFVEFGVGESVDIVALEQADVFQTGEAEGFAEVMQEVARPGIVGRLFFNENAVHQRRGLGKRGMLKGVTARASGMGQPLTSRG